MSGDYGSFKWGGVVYPLATGTGNSLLQDADPAVYYASLFFKGMLGLHMGARFMAEVAACSAPIDSIVGTTMTNDPAPYLRAGEFSFPLLSVYRQTEKDQRKTVTWDDDSSIWEVAYIFPALTMRQADILTPALRSAGRIIAHAAKQGMDSNYLGGLNVWQATGIEKCSLVSAKYGGYHEVTDAKPDVYQAWIGQFEVWERDASVLGTLGVFQGADVALSLQSSDGTILPVTSFSTTPTPTLTVVTPSTATTAGGTTLILGGSFFETGAGVTIGGVSCTNVMVPSNTTIWAAAPALAAGTYSVVVTNPDGSSVTLASGYTTQ